MLMSFDLKNTKILFRKEYYSKIKTLLIIIFYKQTYKIECEI